MKKNNYTVKKLDYDVVSFTNKDLWENIKSIEIKHYLWMNNGYTPKVIAKLLYSDNYIYVFFKVFEKKISIQYTNLGDPVYKDSCVEFFFNPFPYKSKDYFNIEINAAGAMLIGVGESRAAEKRNTFSKDELSGFEIITSVKQPLSGYHGKDFWTLHYKIPIKFFENHYKISFASEPGIGNFYKCGDETEFEHYGAWNFIHNKTPNFHLPQYFGEIQFEH